MIPDGTISLIFSHKYLDDIIRLEQLLQGDRVAVQQRVHRTVYRTASHPPEHGSA